MGIDAEDFGSDLIDVSGLSLRDLGELSESSLGRALHELLTSNDTGPSAGFSSRIKAGK
jgi:FXSXX-COOH protein